MYHFVELSYGEKLRFEKDEFTLSRLFDEGCRINQKKIMRLHSTSLAIIDVIISL